MCLSPNNAKLTLNLQNKALGNLELLIKRISEINDESSRKYSRVLNKLYDSRKNVVYK